MEINLAKDIEVKILFDQLTQTNSSLAKRDIIIENKENELFKQFLNFLLNPFLVTGISMKKISKEVDKTPTKELISFTEVMEYLLKNNTGSDEVIANVRLFLSKCDPDMREFFVSIITKSARIGCEIKSVNKALGFEFIPQWEVQQGFPIEKYPLKEGEWFSISVKLNGVRGTFYNGKIISRQGKEIAGLDHIINDISKLFEDSDDWVLDGELVRQNIDGLSDNENFRIGTGLLGQDDADKSLIQLIFFDILPRQDFIKNESQLSYKERLSILGNLYNRIAELQLENIAVVDVLYCGDDASQIDHYLDMMVEEDKEGLMLNRDTKYFRKRHNGILKIKRFYTVDLKITALEEGSGRNVGRLGAFVVDYKGNPLNVGSGFTDEQREEFWRLSDELIGRVIEVKYKEESQDKKTGFYSLQFPIFVTLREEGKEVSYN